MKLHIVFGGGGMPQIPQHYLDCSIYLYDSRASAEDGENFGGSGCLVQVDPSPILEYAQVQPNTMRHVKSAFVCPPHIYAVTNKHVVEQGCPVMRLNTVDDRWDVLELEVDDWFLHPDGDDLAVAPIELPKGKHNYYSIGTHVFLHRDNLSSVGAGDDTFMVGRFINHEGKQRNTPSLRFGSIAMLPFEKVKLPDGYMQEAFLVEVRSLSGYSGSPVFVYRPTEQTTYIPSRSISDDIYAKSITSLVGYPNLLGIDCGHVLDHEDVLDASGRATGWRVRSNTGMAIVIPAWRLYDLLHSEELVMRRKQKDKEYYERKEAEKQTSNVAFDVAKPNNFTAEDYQDALKRASRKISSPNGEKSQT